MNKPQLSAQDQADLDSLGIDLEDAKKRSLLEVWHELLTQGVEANAKEKVSVGVAAKIVASWPFLTFQETAQYHELYHTVIGELAEVVVTAVREHPEALLFYGEDDGRENHVLYREILATWHNQLGFYEDQWTATDPDSHLWVAVIADARAFFFSGTGMVGHLDAIGFQLTNEEFMAALQPVEEKSE